MTTNFSRFGEANDADAKIVSRQAASYAVPLAASGAGKEQQ